jgi:hypothetical protein|nr:hypothetical protein 7 [bacterium]
MTIEHVLALDIAGNPFEWLSPQEAVTLYVKDKVAWDLGSTERVFWGGMSRAGQQSSVAIKPIVAVAGSERMVDFTHQPIPLGERDNALLFSRDRNTCAYCGLILPSSKLTRDHIHPRSRGGQDTWMNCVTACARCNNDKDDKLVQDFKPLLYVPYLPSRFEHFILSGRHVLADQHEYLAAQLPKHSRLRH